MPAGSAAARTGAAVARVALAPWQVLAAPLRPALSGAERAAAEGLRRVYDFAMFGAPGPLRRLEARISYDVLSRGLTAALPKDLVDPSLDAVTMGSGFLNYGYADDDHDAFVAGLDEALQARSHSVRLYHHALGETDPADRALLEVGCGRGGGCSYMMASHAPRSVTGVDISPTAITFARYAHTHEGLDYVVGDAEALPFADDAFEIVVNVESSHCYGSMTRFLTEARRVLAPGGLLAWVDARPLAKVAATERCFSESGLVPVRETDISANVLRALDATSDEKIALVDEQVPFPLRPFVRQAMAVRGSIVYEQLADGRLRYLSKLLRNPDPV